MLGLAQPTGGSGRVFGKDILKENDEIRRRAGYLSQDPRFCDTLRFTARFFYPGPKAETESRVAETLELVGLAGKADRPVKGFSGGERQRQRIAQAQVNYPELLILSGSSEIELVAARHALSGRKHRVREALRASVRGAGSAVAS